MKSTSTIIKNIFFLAGVACLGVGLWWQSPSAALVTLGGLFLAIWFVAFWKAAKG